MTTDRPAWRPPENYINGPGVHVPVRICALLERYAHLHDVRVGIRGHDAELDSVLQAIAEAADRWRASVRGNLHPQPAETPSDSWLTTRQVADRLGLTERRVRQLAAAGQLPAALRAGRWEVDPVDLEHYTSARTAA